MSSTIIDKLNLIVEKSYKLSLRQLRLEFNDNIIEEIKRETTDNLYNNFIIEYETTYYEIIYGNNDSITENVKEHFLKSVRYIIENKN
jgi:hypothetical protein